MPWTGPVGRQRLAGAEDLLDDDVERPVRALAASRRASRASRHATASRPRPVVARYCRRRSSKTLAATASSVVLLEPLEVLLRVEQAVGVVDAQAVDVALARASRRISSWVAREHLLPLDAQGGQVVDVEEPAVVDLVRRDPPEASRYACASSSSSSGVEAVRVAGPAVEQRDGLLDELARPRRACAASVGQPPLDDLLLALALAPPGRGRSRCAAAGARRRSGCSGTRSASGVSAPELPLQLVQPVRQDRP